MIRPHNSGRTMTSVAGPRTRGGPATGKTTSVAIGNVATKKRGEITITTTAPAPAPARMIAGGATIATAMGDCQIEAATIGDGGKRTPGVNASRTFGGGKTIASDSGKFAISTFAKCAV